MFFMLRINTSILSITLRNRKDMTVERSPGILGRLPDNKNTALDNKFQFQIFKLPHVEYFTKTVTLPGLSANLLYSTYSIQ